MNSTSDDSKQQGQTITMQRFVSRVNRMLLFSLVYIVIIAVFLVYQPMEAAIKNSLIENFTQLSKTSDLFFEAALLRGVEAAESLSSRTAIKDAIIDYRDGKMTLIDLQRFTQPKYEDGARAIEHLLLAERVVDDVVIASFSPSGFMGEALNWIEGEMNAAAVLQIDVHEDGAYAVIVSPIKIGETIAGYDRIVYNLDEQMQLLQNDSIHASLLEQAAYDVLVNGSSVVWSNSEARVFRKDSVYYFANFIQCGVYYVVSEDEQLLFTSFRELATRIYAFGGTAFAAFILIAFFYIVRYAKNKLGSLERSRNAYKEIAYFDQLTGAYTRQYLDIWNQSIRSQSLVYAIVMIDVDDLKRINDTYGHIAGDKVLKQLSSNILSSIRQSDLLVRYGGDEFVLILTDVDNAKAGSLMERIRGQIDAIDVNPAWIHISYGISALIGDEDFEKAIRIADSEMYEIKKAKKTAQ